MMCKNHHFSNSVNTVWVCVCNACNKLTKVRANEKPPTVDWCFNHACGRTLRTFTICTLEEYLQEQK